MGEVFKLPIRKRRRHGPNLQGACLRKGCLPKRGYSRIDLNWTELDIVCDALLTYAPSGFSDEAVTALFERFEVLLGEDSWTS